MNKRPVSEESMFSSSFDGRSSKRNVSMGGRKREEDKSAFLARARNERMTRENERKRSVGAGNIQRWWRGRVCSSKIKASFRETWDGLVSNLEKVIDTFKAVNVPFSPPVASVIIFAKQFMFFHSLKNESDIKRLMKLLNFIFLTAQSRSNDDTVNFMAFSLKPFNEASQKDGNDKDNEQVFLTARLLSLAFIHLPTISKDGTREEVGMCCELLKMITSNINLSSCETHANNHPLAKLILLLGTRKSKFSFEDMQQKENKTIIFFNPMFHCLANFLTTTHHESTLLISQSLLDISTTALKVSSAPIESGSDLILKHFIEEVLFMTRLETNAKFFIELSRVLLADGAKIWWQLVSYLVSMYKSSSKPKQTGPAPAPAFGFGFASTSTPLSAATTSSSTSPLDSSIDIDKVPITAVANLLALLEGNFTSLDLSEHHEQAHSLMFLLYHFVSSLPASIIYNPELLKKQRNKNSAASTSGSGAAESSSSSSSSIWDEDDDDDDDGGLGEEAMSNGIKGLELRVNQERRRQLLASSSSSSTTTQQMNRFSCASQVLSMLCKPNIVAALFDAILPEVTPTQHRDISCATGEGGGGLNKSSNSSNPVQNESILLLCSTFGLLLTHGAHRSTSLLQVLAMKVKNSIPRLWTYFCTHHPRHVLPHLSNPSISNSSAASATFSFSTSSTSSIPSSSALLASKENSATLLNCSRKVKGSLYLFISTCSRLLLSIDDEDFFTNNKMLEMDEQLQLSLMLRSHLMEMLWEFPCFDEVGDILSLELLYNSARLFNQIYDRHARREFMMGISREHWHWPQSIHRELSSTESGSSGRGGGGGGGGSEESINFGSRRASLVLTCIPEVIPFFQRVRLFHSLISKDKSDLGLEDRQFFTGGATDITVSRETIYEDALATLDRLGPNLKGRIRVMYQSDLGHQEAGIDGGGLFRDFMDKLTEKCFDPASKFFKETSDHLLYPDPTSSITPGYSRHFEFMGRVLGKAVYEQMLLRPQFAVPFLNKLLDRNNVIDDLYTIDPELYKHLLSLKRLAKTDGMNLEDLSLFFTVGTGGKSERLGEVELIPNGSNVAVTNANYLEYIYRVAHFKLNSETSRQSRAFLRGFHDLIPVDWIKMFDARELQMVIGGELRALDIENMQRFTNYGGGYHPSQPIIGWFWEVLSEFTPQEQSDFLKFVTSSSRQPLLGFEYLNPMFCIQKVPLDDAGQKLPSAGTCMSLLKLPEYRDKETMRKKILYAISSNAGFELS